LMVGVILSILSLVLAHPILRAMGASGDILQQGIIFFRVIAGTSVLIVLMTVLGQLIRTAGQTRTPLTINLIVNILNFCLDFILIFGLFLMYATHKIKYTYFSGISLIAIFLAIPLLMLTLMKGSNLNEASRWLALPGTSLTFQTSDLAKLALIMYVSRVLSQKQEKIKSFKDKSSTFIYNG